MSPTSPTRAPGADPYVRALRRGLAVLMVLLLLRSGVYLREHAAVYSPAWVERAAFGLLVVVTALVVASAVLDRDLGRVRWVVVVSSLLASGLATAAVPADALVTSAHWSWYMIGWFLVVAMIGRPVPELVGLLAAHLGLVVVQVTLAGGLNRANGAELIVHGLPFTVAQLVFGTAAWVAARSAATAESIREREAEQVTHRQIAEQVRRDQAERHQVVAATAIPLLEGLRAGDLSPDDPDVRRRCLAEATRLRRLMAESDQGADPLSHELRACVDVAERAGVQVDVSFRGAGPTPDRDERRRLTEPVILVLGSASRRARLTVVGTPRDVLVSVVAEVDAGSEEVVVPELDGVQVNVTRAPGTIWVTARWEAA